MYNCMVPVLKVRNEGFSSLYRGFFPTWTRLVSSHPLTRVHTHSHIYTPTTYVQAHHICTRPSHMYAPTCTYTHTLTHVHTHVRTRPLTHVHTHHICTPITHVHTHSHIYTPTHACTHPLTHVHTHSHMYTPTHTCTHPLTHIHTHTLQGPWSMTFWITLEQIRILAGISTF